VDVGVDVHCRYACWTARLLLAAHIHSAAAGHGPLSVADAATVQLAVQAVCVWGIAPYLDAGVGYPALARMPDHDRSRVPVLRAAPFPATAAPSLGPAARIAQLQYMARVMWACIHPATPIRYAACGIALSGACPRLT
jgi:hypothetical protein